MNNKKITPFQIAYTHNNIKIVEFLLTINIWQIYDTLIKEKYFDYTVIDTYINKVKSQIRTYVKKANMNA